MATHFLASIDTTSGSVSSSNSHPPVPLCPCRAPSLTVPCPPSRHALPPTASHHIVSHAALITCHAHSTSRCRSHGLTGSPPTRHSCGRRQGHRLLRPAEDTIVGRELLQRRCTLGHCSRCPLTRACWLRQFPTR
jgi:hypothetical protein